MPRAEPQLVARVLPEASIQDTEYGHAQEQTFARELANRCGVWFGKICCCIAAVDDMYWRWQQWWRPDSSFELAPDHPNIAHNSQYACAHQSQK